MKNYLILLIVVLCVAQTAIGFTIKGGVSYTVNEARQIAFDGVAQKIDMSKYKEYFVDKNFEKNQELLDRGKTRYRDRELTKFSDGSYGILYKTNKSRAYYYDKKGLLTGIDFIENGEYPKRSLKYIKNGELDSICIFVSGDEQFLFEITGELGAHWIGNNCYNEKGELIKTRR